MEIDTGSAVTLLPEAIYKTVSTEPLQESNIKLCTYSGEKLEVKGSATCKVEYGNETYKFPIVVLAGNGPTLLGRNWLYHILIQWTKLFHSILNQFPICYRNIRRCSLIRLACIQVEGEHVHVDQAATPRFCKPCLLPFAMKEKVEAELRKLQV